MTFARGGILKEMKNFDWNLLAIVLSVPPAPQLMILN
jgi:hypothetical protein